MRQLIIGNNIESYKASHSFTEVYKSSELSTLIPYLFRSGTTSSIVRACVCQPRRSVCTNGWLVEGARKGGGLKRLNAVEGRNAR